jgi:hypothetical protein
MSDTPYTFDSPDADIILRAPLHPDVPESTEFKDFHTHKVILSTSSAFFHGMFSVPQPRHPAEDDIDNTNLPVVHVVEPAEVFEIFLRLIYPIEPPVIESIQIVDHLSQLAIKYMVGCVRARLKQVLASPSFLTNDPIWVYAIACRMDLDEEAKQAVPHTYRIDLTRDVPRPLLRAMTAEANNSLLRSHATRREGLTLVINQAKAGGCRCSCGPFFYTRLVLFMRLAIGEEPFLDRQRLDSCLSQVQPKSECKCGSSCRVSAEVISAYFTRILNKIGELV